MLLSIAGLTCAGFIGRNCYKLIQSIRSRNRHRQNIYCAIMPNLTEKYVIKHKLLPNETFQSIIAQGEQIHYRVPLYNTSENITSPDGKPLIETSLNFYQIIRHLMHPPYCFVDLRQLYSSYDEKYKNVVCIPYHDALKYFEGGTTEAKKTGITENIARADFASTFDSQWTTV
jgi:hypothetical protein